jgi:hypothetical protein
MRTTHLLTFLFCVFLSPLWAAAPLRFSGTLEWFAAPQRIRTENGVQSWWSFKGALHDDATPLTPFVVLDFPVQGSGTLQVRILDLRTEALPGPWPATVPLPPDRLSYTALIEKDRQGYFGKISFAPFLLVQGSVHRVLEYELEATWAPQTEVQARSGEFASESALRTGTIYKISVAQEGMHKISYDFLKNELKIDIDRIDPRQIALWGNSGGMLPELVGVPKPDDLVEIPVFIAGESDGRFDAGDYLLFYAEGPDKWSYQAGTGRFSMEKNIYSQQQFYFLKIGSGTGQRVVEQASLATAAYPSQGFDDFARLETDKINLLHQWVKSKGSGKRWYGDQIRNVREYKYDKFFTFPNLIAESPVLVRAEMALRALQVSRFTLSLNGTTLNSGLAERVVELEGELDNIRDYAKNALLEGSLNLNSDAVEAIIRYAPPGGPNDGSEGWVDYIELQARRRLVFTGDQMAFRDVETLGQPSSSFELSGAVADVAVWDISNPLQPKVQVAERSAQKLSFRVATETLRQFIAFNPTKTLYAPKAVGKVENQNLHGISRADLLLIYPASMAVQATQLAAHRRKHSGLVVEAIEVEQVYNEFSSGKKDPSAIRNFARMVYLRDPGFQYLLLFGDGSFDARDLYGFGGDHIPTYQNESFNPLFAFPADDYFALLEPVTGSDPLSGRLQIGVGRLPVNTPEEASGVVAKIIHYDTAPTTLSDWRNRMLVVGDDEDGMQHTRDANIIADDIQAVFPALNLEKVFVDAYPQSATSGGNRVPGVTEAINEAIFKGVLIVTYLGHGGPNGWAQERILTIPDILNWKNLDRQALFLTATCSFTNYDDPTFSSAGEEAFLNPQGGAMALMTTTRAVFANQNAVLTEKSLAALFTRQNDRYPTLGEAMRQAKNSSSSIGITTNSRKFSLIGDPSQQLAIPRYQIRTTAIDSKPITGQTDTLRALQRVEVAGEVTDGNGRLLEDFNGVLYPTVFDKSIQTATLGQDAGSYAYPYQLQKNVIFRGRSSIRKGLFRFTFIVPKDINYAFGNGKISYFAAHESTQTDAAGYYERFVIGGNSPAQVSDRTGPVVEVFMNNFDFIPGSVTEPDPLLLVRLSDDNGINVVGNSIGHDLEAVLDEQTQNAIVLNDFFTAALDDYRKGEARYPLADLSEGTHRIRVKAWDIANNASEGYTEFIVAGSEGIALQQVLNYPNPFTDYTCFQFDHNFANQPIEALIQIYTISGRLVKTISQSLFSDGSLRQDDCIPWDGRDDYGDRLARGVYLYKVKIRTTLAGAQSIEGESTFEKLVLLK